MKILALIFSALAMILFSSFQPQSIISRDIAYDSSCEKLNLATVKKKLEQGFSATKQHDHFFAFPGEEKRYSYSIEDGSEVESVWIKLNRDWNGKYTKRRSRQAMFDVNGEKDYRWSDFFLDKRSYHDESLPQPKISCLSGISFQDKEVSGFEINYCIKKDSLGNCSRYEVTRYSANLPAALNPIFYELVTEKEKGIYRVSLGDLEDQSEIKIKN